MHIYLTLHLCEDEMKQNYNDLYFFTITIKYQTPKHFNEIVDLVIDYILIEFDFQFWI